MVKTVRDKYFSDLIEKNVHNSRVLFSTINAVIHPPASDGIDVSVQTCKTFRTHFMEKIARIKSSIQPSDHDPSIPPATVSAVFHRFEPCVYTYTGEVSQTFEAFY